MCGVLRLIEHDEGIREGAAAHVSEWRDFDDTPLDHLHGLLFAHHVVHCIIERSEVGQYLFLQFAGQKTERFARFDCGASEDDPLDVAR